MSPSQQVPDQLIELSLKRHLDAGPYERADALALDAALPQLSSAARVARHTLDAEARGMALLLRQRGAAVFELDRGGRVRSGDGMADCDVHAPVRVLGRRLIAADPALQPGLDRAVGKALAQPGIAEEKSGGAYGSEQPPPCPARASSPGKGPRHFPVDRRARGCDRGGARCAPPAGSWSVVRDAFGLTGREAEVASLLAEGASLATISRRLRVEPATARTDLKRIFEKTRTGRQTELVALLSRLRL